MAPPLALGEVPEEVRMNKLIGMNAPPAAKVYNEKERYHVECCVEIKFYGAFALNLRVDLHAIDATPAR